MADGHLRTTAVPLKMDGTFDTGGTAPGQIALALDNLDRMSKAAGGEIADVIQALCFLTNADQPSVLDAMDQSDWRSCRPTPNRAHPDPTLSVCRGSSSRIHRPPYIEP